MYFVYSNFLQLCEQILKTHSEVCFLCPLKSLWLLLLLFYWSQWELELTWCHDLWKEFLLRKKYQEIPYATVDLPLWIPFTIPYSSCHAQWLCIEAPVIINRSRSWVQTLWHLHRSRGLLCSCSKSNIDIHMHIVPPTSPKQKPGLSTEQSREHLGCPALGEPFWGWDFDTNLLHCFSAAVFWSINCFTALSSRKAWSPSKHELRRPCVPVGAFGL